MVYISSLRDEEYIKLAVLSSQCLLSRQVAEGGKQLKSVLYHSPALKQTQIASSYSLLSLIINNYGQFWTSHELITERSKVSIGNPYLLMVMMAEYINIGKIVGGGKLKKIIVDNQNCLPKVDRASRINKQVVQGVKDAMIPNLYNIPHEQYSILSRDKTLDLLQSSACMVQSFSSSLPAFLLLQGVSERWGSKRFDVMDACAAPGNKTLQLADYLGGAGKIFAFEKNQRRYQLLCRTISKYSVDNIVAQNQDFLTVGKQKRYKKVKFVLLDPSCSGSGMLTNFTRDSNFNANQNSSQSSTQCFESFCERRYSELSGQQKERVQNLHKFQVQLLNHAASFAPLRLSYSTCSIYKRENEDVIEEFLSSHPEYRIKRVKLKHGWVSEGFGAEFGGCVRVDPRRAVADGFFVSILTRGGAK